MNITRILPLLAVMLATGCATQQKALYQWGGYENQIYAMYADSGKSSPQEQIANLERDLEKARAANRPLPPGFQAHLGYLYYQTGRLDQAIAAFETEKLLFPESRPYMDRLILQATR